MNAAIFLLTDLSYATGLIGLAEYEERMEVASWLSDVNESQDPRGNVENEERFRDGAEERQGSGALGGVSLPPQGDDLQFLALNTWMFTVGDPDCYPSVPHGHYQSKKRKWPKLNPYTGRVFKDVHIEDVGARLSRAKMQQLWDDEDFVERCRQQVLWYSEFAPRYSFPNARRGKLVFPRWR